MLHTRALGTILCSALAVTGAAAASQPSPRADTLIPAQPPLVLELPAEDPVLTGAVVQRLLTASRIPFGLEVVQPREPLDFGRAAAGALVLNGMSVKQALDAIVAADRRYVWQESDGRIIVRAATSSGVLPLRVGAFTLTNVPLQDVMEQIVTRLDPSVKPSLILGGVVGGLVPGSARPAPPAAPPGPQIASVVVPDGSLLDVLNAAGRAFHASWRVRYEAEGTGPGSAAVAFFGADHRHQIASPPRVVRELATPSRLRIPVGPRVDAMVASYASRVGLRYAIEAVPMPVESFVPFPSGDGYPPLDLTGIPTAEALSRIIALDSRYEWFDSAGVINVRPRGTPTRTALLEREVDGFSADGELLEDLLPRVLSAVGATALGPAMPEAPRRLEGARLVEHPRGPQLTFSVGRSTVRDVLNALCRAEGTLSWVFQPQPPGTRGEVFAFVQLQSADGWSLSRNFRLRRW